MNIYMQGRPLVVRFSVIFRKKNKYRPQQPEFSKELKQKLHNQLKKSIICSIIKQLEDIKKS